MSRTRTLLEDAIDASSVLLSLPETKDDALAALVAPLALRVSRSAEDLLEAVQKREEIMTTGMGHGVAVPHAKVAGISGPVLSVGVAKKGIEYGALDGGKVRIVALFLTPQENPKEHVKFLAELTKRLKYAHVRQKILDAGDAAEVVEAFRSG